jgi:hypothetical protein
VPERIGGRLPRGLRVVAGVCVVVVAGLLAAVATGGRASRAAECGTVRAAGHVYIVVANNYSCATARSYVGKLAPEKPIGAHTALATGKLSGGPGGYSCSASGYPQRISRCFKGLAGFTWVKES